jgi:hypothetical protein
MLVLSVEVYSQLSDADSVPALFVADIVPAEAFHDLSKTAVRH